MTRKQKIPLMKISLSPLSDTEHNIEIFACFYLNKALVAGYKNPCKQHDSIRIKPKRNKEHTCLIN
jgi:hypothetical protein